MAPGGMSGSVKNMVVQRLSVRGAFGAGAMFNEQRRSSEILSRAQVFQLDRCLDPKELDKILLQFSMSAEVNPDVGKQGLLGNRETEYLEYNIEGFAKFLTRIQAMSSLMFWKDAEEFSMLFGLDERKERAQMIYKKYLVPGAEMEVSSLQGPSIKKIADALAKPPEDLFAGLQQDVYAILLFDLFPRFWEDVKTQDRQGKVQRPKMSKDTRLEDVIAANDLEIHLFAEYCREHLCEDMVIFLLETQMYALLFDASDLLMTGRRIYDTYLDPASESRIVVSDKAQQAIANALTSAGQPKPGMAGAPPVKPDLFEKVFSEVINTLKMDVWPRYVAAVLEGKSLQLTSVDAVDVTTYVDMTVPSKKAVAAALRNAKMADELRQIALESGGSESIDFCIECQNYRLLFDNADREPRAKLIYQSYLKAGADKKVNVPDTMVKKVEATMAKDPAAADMFEVCSGEIIQVISDNIFSQYLKLQKQQEEEQKAAAEAAAAEKPPPPKDSGGCCVIS